MLDIRSTKVDWCVITKTTSVGFEHALRDYPYFQDSKKCENIIEWPSKFMPISLTYSEIQVVD